MERYREAEKAFARAARYQRNVIDPDVCGLYCCLLAKLREEQGRSEEALALLQRAAYLLEEIGQIDEVAQALLDKANVELRRCCVERYLVDLQVVIGLMDEGLSADLAAVAVGIYGIELQGRGRVEEALSLLDSFWAHYPYFGTPDERAELFLLEGTLLMSAGRREKAEQRLKEALRYFLQWNDSTSAMRASLSLAVLLLREGGREADLKTLAQESLRPLGRALSMPKAARVALRKFFAAVESGTATASEASALLEVAGLMSEQGITEASVQGKGGRK